MARTSSVQTTLERQSFLFDTLPLDLPLLFFKKKKKKITCGVIHGTGVLSLSTQVGSLSEGLSEGSLSYLNTVSVPGHILIIPIL